METKLNSLNTESNKIGLKIHNGNTKYITNFNTTESIKIDNNKQRIINIYPGKKIKMEDNKKRDLDEN